MSWILRARTWALFVLVSAALWASVADAAPVSVKPGNAAATQFPQALQCVCHGMLLGEWKESMHAKALDDPLFKAKVAEADKASGGKLGPFCRRCHAPVANITGQDRAETLTPAAAQGVVCSFCHQVVGMKGPTANVPHLLELTGVMRAHLRDAQAPHFTEYSKLHTTSKICGGCHNVNHPVNNLPLETTYTEWQKSPQARAGTQCQDCHMSAGPPEIGPSVGWAADGAPERKNIYHMTFAGPQVALGNAVRATALLKSAATVEVEAPEVLSAAPKAEVTVKITNVGAGHYLPTGLTEERQMWLSVVAIDGAGVETEVGKRVFGTELKDSKGNHPVELWDATGIAKDDRIPPRKSVTQSFKLVLPQGVDAADITARLLYKSVSDKLASAAGVQNPTTTMAEATTRVFATEQAKAADAGGGASSEGTGAGGAAKGGGVSPQVVTLMGVGLLALVVGAVLFLQSRKSGDA